MVQLLEQTVDNIYMKPRRYTVLFCSRCNTKHLIRTDQVRENYVCRSCSKVATASDKFWESLGEAKELIKDTHVAGKHRWVLVDCVKCQGEFWARFDNWESGMQQCWACAHPNQQKHGKTGTVLHKRWMNVLRRTEHSKEPDKVRVYQDRGIVMCEEWRRNFEAFEKWSL